MSFFQRSAPILALGLCFVLVPASHAIGPKKKKKQVDLSANPLGNVKSQQPDKELYDKAMLALKKGKFDIARLDLQTLMNTYPESEYQMRAKLAVGDTWYKEGGTAAMAQAEQEFKDFITFFPNTPEAAEAQMKVGDIYFSEMDKPDRDPQNANHAEDEYRQMIQQFPDSQLVPRAKQRLREVQEVLAQRQFEIGEFYSGRENWGAAIARLQTVADNYPLFSHSDQTLITMGDAYAQEASYVANIPRLPPKAKAELEKAYNDRAAQAWNRVVTRYPMSAHVEDAKDRLIAAGRTVPEPTAAEMAESEAEEGSRAPIRLKDRALLLIQHGPTVIQSARVGEPTMTDAPATLAPAVNQRTADNFTLAMKGEPIPAPPPLGVQPAETAANAGAAAAPSSGGTAEPAVTMENVPDNSGSGDRVGAEVVGTSSSASVPGPSDAAPSSTDSAPPAESGAAPGASGTPVNSNNVVPTPSSGTAVGAPSTPGASVPTPAAANPDRVYGLAQPVGPKNPAPLPPVEKPADAPDQINDVKRGPQPQVSTGTATGKPSKKKPKPAFDSSDESSSKHHKKKGVDKLNPF